MKALVVSDDAAIKDMLLRTLQRYGHDVASDSDGTSTWRAVRGDIDLIVYDLGQATEERWDGLCQWLSAVDLPLIAIGPLDQGQNAVKALRIGADDYMERSSRVAELVARMEALLRRVRVLNRAQPCVVQGEGISLDRRACQAKIDDRIIDLTPTEFKVLEALMQRPGATVSRADIARSVWGSARPDAESNLSLYIWHLRQKLEENPSHPKLILTRRGVGYAFQQPDEA